MEGGGFASTMMDQTGTQMLYFQTLSSGIVEKRFLNGAWQFQDPNNPNTSIAGIAPGPGNTISALSYTFGGNTYRSLFFIDSSGNVCTSNSTSKLGETTFWTDPVQLSSTPVFTSSTAGLAACVDSNPNNWNGIMVFYGDTSANIRSLGFDFATPKKGWVDKSETFGAVGIDGNSGLSCTLTTTPATGPIVNLYGRLLKHGTFWRTLMYMKAKTTDTFAGSMRIRDQVFRSILHTLTDHSCQLQHHHPVWHQHICRVGWKFGLVSPLRPC
jgi:hypothetical protein